MDNEAYHDIVHRLVGMMANQHTFNGSVRTAIDRLTLAIERIDLTLARITDMLKQSENGTDN